jgi:hypothetical protein
MVYAVIFGAESSEFTHEFLVVFGSAVGTRGLIRVFGEGEKEFEFCVTRLAPELVDGHGFGGDGTGLV